MQIYRRSLGKTLHLFSYILHLMNYPPALSSMSSMDIETLSGIIESVETFSLESNKGKNQGNKTAIRKPHKRGDMSSLRGISYEQVCVLVAMDRNIIY